VCAEVRGAQLRNAAFKILARALSSLKLLNSATLALFHDQESGCNERLQLLLLLERRSSARRRGWCLLFVLIRHGLIRGGSGPQRLIRALGIETGNPIMTYEQRSSFLPSAERAPHHTSPRIPAGR